MRRLRIMRKSRQSHAGAHAQVQILLAAEDPRPQRILQTFRHHHRLIFAGLRQQHHKLVATVAEGEINQPQLRFDQVPDFGQQPASHQMSMRVVDRLEVVEVDEDHAELVAEARRAVDLGFKGFVQMARIEQARAIVGDGQFLNLLDRPRILNRNRGIVAQRLQKEHLLLSQAHVGVDQLDHAQYAVFRAQRHADDRAGLQLRHLVQPR